MKNDSTRVTMTAHELCANYKNQRFRVKGGRVIWECITYMWRADKCLVQRLIPGDGKPGIYILSMRIIQSYISNDTEVEVID